MSGFRRPKMPGNCGHDDFDDPGPAGLIKEPEAQVPGEGYLR